MKSRVWSKLAGSERRVNGAEGITLGVPMVEPPRKERELLRRYWIDL